MRLPCSLQFFLKVLLLRFMRPPFAPLVQNMLIEVFEALREFVIRP